MPPQAPHYFVTGTDTEIGKSYCSQRLLRYARGLELRCHGFKPIESGDDGEEFGPDAISLGLAAGHPPSNLYSFAEPIAPSKAAHLAGIEIELELIVARTRELQIDSEFLLVEGAGGFLAPITEDLSIADLALAIELPILLVVPDRLGSINHALLTAEAIARRGLDLAALILNPIEGAKASLGNAEALKSRLQSPVLFADQSDSWCASLF